MKLSVTAPSKQFPTSLMLPHAIIRARPFCWAWLTYWIPRSVWCSKPSPGCRRPIALRSAYSIGPTLSFGSLAGYAIARLKFFGREVLFTLA
jgi:hypothetical protein